MTATLRVRGLGHVPSFKNCKRVMNRKLVTDPKIKRWMNRCIQGFVSQLLSPTVTGADVTQTEQQLRSLIASLPPDDCWTQIRSLLVYAVEVPKGYEGATITISPHENNPNTTHD